MMSLNNLRTEETTVIMLSPQGKLFNQQEAIQLSAKKHIILLCGHYEGIDARVEQLIDMELSIGDYVLTGGEIPAMIVADTVSRLIPGVIHEESAGEDSLQNGWLKYPQYTKPESYEGFSVPEVLISGNHQWIETWRKESSVIRTVQKRPDLIKNIKLTEEERKLLKKMGFTSKE
jgi:tRNA (guanine37-N1)-methyltransferase